MDETTAGHQKTSSGSSVNTLSEALQELGILQHQNQSLREENNNLQNQLEACRANLHEAGQAMMAIAEIHEANGKAITRLDQFLKRVTTEVNNDEIRCPTPTHCLLPPLSLSSLRPFPPPIPSPSAPRMYCVSHTHHPPLRYQLGIFVRHYLLGLSFPPPTIYVRDLWLGPPLLASNSPFFLPLTLEIASHGIPRAKFRTGPSFSRRKLGFPHFFRLVLPGFPRPLLDDENYACSAVFSIPSFLSLHESLRLSDVLPPCGRSMSDLLDTLQLELWV
ncbi:hypothetical protein C8J57DRAFT_1710536 [Mycena rebaudengoi]|nr:hypothetical protein C8J57DRAFT_1710536 [Mycena rebaudengoi]